ncbi:ATP-binding response regulator [Rhodovibrionaceae bacterium A322]
MGASLLKTTDFLEDRARLFAKTPEKIFLGHIACAAALIYLAQENLSFPWLLLWGGWEIFLTPGLLFLLGRAARRPEAAGFSLQRWQRQLELLFLAIGTSWGTFLFFSLDVTDPAHFAMQMAIAAGASAAATRSLGIFRASFYFYILPFLGLLALRIFWEGGDYILLGCLVLIFLVMMCGLASDTSQELSRFLATKMENLDLAEKYQQAAREADRANAAKTQFLAQANHDMRQPIHAIGLLTECLRDQKLTREGREILDSIDLSIDNLAKLFKSLLNISTLDAGAIRPDVTAFALDDVLRQIQRQALPEAREQGCSLKVLSTGLWVETDKALLSSILQNLVFNAVKHAAGSKILVGVRRRGQEVCLIVLDQGKGVPEHLQEEIFGEFVRGNPEGPGRVDGLGLGLSIVARTAKLLNLTVTLTSQLDRGTKVEVAGLAVTEAGVAADLPVMVPDLAGQAGLKVLVIDDNPQVLESVKALLSRWDYAVTAALPGQSLPEETDLLLVDFHLNGEVDGIDLAKSIGRAMTKDLPTAIISGTITAEIEARAEEAGFLVLHKPVAPAQLRSLMLALEHDCLN